ncbi:MAG: NTP transferase domain-containing protein [Geodermatophilaceae bacterium]|nr:NTP transferase domain-containing protein [Geodermatophilaceae bacterium]
MTADHPAQESPAQVAGLVLAAGAGRRYGMPKALVSYEGGLLVERAYRLVADVCEVVIVVLGAAADEVRSRADLGDAQVVINRDWDTGMGSSLRTGLAALGPSSGGFRHNRHEADLAPAPGGFRQNRHSGSGPDLIDWGLNDAALVHLVDLPGMTVAALRRIAGHAAADVLAVASYSGVRGHPVLLGRTHWVGVAAAAIGDQGARGYLATRDVLEVECADVADPADLDYPPS